MKPLLIGGAPLATSHGRENRNPSDLSDIIDIHAEAGVAETQSAIAAARAAFPAWSRTNAAIRHDIFRVASAELRDRAQEIGTLLSREEGKLLADGIAETHRAAQILEFFAGEVLQPMGEIVPSVREGVGIEITREAVGVIGVITPWNFPIAIPAWKIAPALAFGNTVVFKPAELVPGSAWALTDCLIRAGLPEGVLNLVTGPGRVVGQTLVDDPGVNAITFTGSQPTGARIAAGSASRMARAQLEMGGKNPLVVLDDADLDSAVEIAFAGAYGQAGQRCTASSRLIVQDGICGRFTDALAERVRTMRIGPALDPESQMGPVASAEQLESVSGFIEAARRDGASLRVGGQPVRAETEGYFLQPALFAETHPGMEINREEVFGPVASIIRVRDYDAALTAANDTPFGLSAGICTTSLKYASDFKRNAEAGMVMVNLPTAGVEPHVAFGGRKGSSYGPREQGRHAREFFTQVKTSYTAP